MHLRFSTITVPLVALLAAALLAIVLAAQAGLSFCNNRVDMMPGMDMPGMDTPGLMICPVVLALIVASAVLAIGAVVLLWRDPHRGVTRRSLARTLANLPPGRTLVSLVLGGSLAVSVMLAVDGSAAPALPTFALSGMLLLASSSVATAFSIITGRCALALGRRIVLAIVTAIAALGAAGASCIGFAVSVRPDGCAVPLLAAGRGLRAPPVFVR